MTWAANNFPTAAVLNDLVEPLDKYTHLKLRLVTKTSKHNGSLAQEKIRTLDDQLVSENQIESQR